MSTQQQTRTSVADGLRLGLGLLIVNLPVLIFTYRAVFCAHAPLGQELAGCSMLMVGLALLALGLRLKRRS